MNIVYIALGSNINPRMDYLQQAINMLKEQEKITVMKYSDIYETEPVGYTEQGKFLNMVIEMKTTLDPAPLLKICQSIERRLGRKREIRWGPRTIDLDILLYNQLHIDMEGLSIPHPRIHERAFVLIPLSDINPELKLSHLNVKVADALKALPDTQKAGVIKWQTVNLE